MQKITARPRNTPAVGVKISMQLLNKLQKDYNQNQSGYQLKLLLNIETIIPDNDSVRLPSQFVEAMD